MPLSIIYSEELERKRIKKTLEKLPWYYKLGYSPRFPKSIDPRNDNLEKIFLALKNEYKEEDYRKSANEIIKTFSEIENSFFEKLQVICGKKIKRKFKLVLTKYDVGGSYSMPNRIIYNFEMKSSSISTILHEIVHLVIEKYIQKYQIQQNEKERIVDLILTSNPIALPNYKMQKRGEEFKNIIDPLFKIYFNPPIDNFLKKLKKSNNTNTKQIH